MQSVGPTVLWLSDVDISSVAEVGGKGANLGECLRAGLPVPPGFCLTTSALTDALADIDDDLSLPEWFIAEVAQAHERLSEVDGTLAMAVRSSATAEDSAMASFAGQAESVLGVVGLPALLGAIRTCWASVTSSRALAYREAKGVDPTEVRAGIVVQQLVGCDVAGVMFTANPVTGAKDAMLVNASYGLGESVVAGLVTPDAFEVAASGEVVEVTIGTKASRIDMTPGGGTVATPVPAAQRSARSLSDGDLAQLAGLGARVAAHYGSPQDIEWGFASGRLYLLQARPITTAAHQVSGHPPAKGRAATAIRDDLIEHFPAPFPLDLHAVREVEQGFLDLAAAGGIWAPAASDLVYGDDDGVIRVRAVGPRPTLGVISRLPRLLRWGYLSNGDDWPRRAASEKAIADRLANRLQDSTNSLSELLAISDEGLANAGRLTRERCNDYLVGLVVWRFKVSRLLRRARTKWAAEDLLHDLDYTTAVVTDRVGKLARLARRLDLTAPLSGATSGDLEGRLVAAPGGGEFLSSWDAFLVEYGARTTNAYLPFSSCSWRENPDELLALISSAATSDAQAVPQSVDVFADVKQRFPARLHHKWRLAVNRWRSLHVAREGTVYALEEHFAVARAAMLLVGEKLVARGQLARLSDLPLLYRAEVGDAVVDPSIDLKPLVARRRPIRPQAEAIWWPPTPAGEGVKGTPGSPGIARGTARVIRSAAEFGRLKPGEILVCPYTDPTWTPLFLLASAIVVDHGGTLSHAAIVAREYGIPAVLGAGNATASIQDGDQIIVNGTTGQVTTHDAESLK